MSEDLKINSPEASSARPPRIAETLPEKTKSSALPGILMIAAVVVGVAGMIGQKPIKNFFHPPLSATTASTIPATSLAPIFAKILPSASTSLPPIPPHAFHLTSISLSGTTRLAVIEGHPILEGHALPVAGQPGWKVAEIHDGFVVLDYLGNRLSCPIEIPAAKPLNDRLHSLN